MAAPRLTALAALPPLPVPRLSPSRIAGPLRAVATSGMARDALAVALLAAVALAFFWPAIAERLVAYENDTLIFYFPLLVQLSEALRSGQLPLWSPHVFTGYPIFADGEAGALYPPHLLTLLALPLETAFVWLRPLRFFQAAAFTYLFCRAVRIGRFGSLVGAVTFAFGGFMVAQMHHTNISTAAVWLPLILAFAELAVRNVGRKRYVFTLLAGVALGLQCLTIHVQIVLMTVLAFAAYCGFRCIAGPVGTGRGPLSLLLAWAPPRTHRLLRRWLGRPLLAAGIVVLAGLVGGALSAAQLLPLFELGAFSFRGSGVDYAYATQYSLRPVQLISLLLPDFFVADGRYWGLWSRWEVFVYTGIAPLALALAGIVAGGRWLVVFFLALLLGGAAMMLGEHSPFDIHRTVSGLPGFSVLRAPGRFVYLVSFSVAMLAALGADAFVRTFRSAIEPAHTLEDALPRAAWRGVLVGSIVLLVQLVAIGAPLALTLAATFVETNKDTVLAWLQATFMRMRGFDSRWTAEQLYQALLASLDIAQPSTLRQLALLLGTSALLLAWDRLRSMRVAWQSLLLMLIAADLVSTGRAFHPAMPFEELAAPSGSTEHVLQQPGLYRVFSQKGIRDEPNRLLAFGVAEANGYASLEPDRHAQYAAAAEYAPNRLLDLMNVRYYAVKNLFVGMPSFNLTSYNPRRPLLSSTGRNPAAQASYALDDVPATALRVVSAMRWAASVAQGTDVAEIIATETGGRQHRFRLEAGVHTAESARERPDLKSTVAHQLAPVARTWEQRDQRGQPYPAHYYFAEFSFSSPVRLRRLEVQFLHPTAQVEIYGLATVDTASHRIEQLDATRLEKFKKVYADDAVILYENQAWLPRAFLVPSAVVEKPSAEILTRMALGDFSPERFVILEEPFDTSKLAPIAPAGTAVPPITFNQPHGDDVISGPGRVHIARYDFDIVRLEVDAKQPAMLFLADLAYPGWRALVDGRETPVYRANYLFRAVFVPAGRHTVEFVYRPPAFRLGLAITLASSVSLVFALALLVAGRPRWPRRGGAVTMSLTGGNPGSFTEKGPESNGRQESKGNGEEERAKGGQGRQEEQVAALLAEPTPLAEAAPDASAPGGMAPPHAESRLPASAPGARHSSGGAA